LVFPDERAVLRVDATSDQVRGHDEGYTALYEIPFFGVDFAVIPVDGAI